MYISAKTGYESRSWIVKSGDVSLGIISDERNEEYFNFHFAQERFVASRLEYYGHVFLHLQPLA